MKHEINIILTETKIVVPASLDIMEWINAALSHSNIPCSLDLSTVTGAEMQNLNKKFRNVDKPTNVLAFSYGNTHNFDAPINHLGDIAICPEVLEFEANEQGIDIMHHFAHIIIHGTLHLLGFTHDDETNACIMEAKETELLKTFGIDDPYGEE